MFFYDSNFYLFCLEVSTFHKYLLQEHLVVLNSCHFCLSFKLFLISFLKDNFIECSILVFSFVSFRGLNLSLHSLLVCETSLLVTLMGIPL